MPSPIWFWQRMLSPHMLGLADALAERHHDVVMVAQEELSQERRAQGWEVNAAGQARRLFIGDLREAEAHLEALPRSTVHITQGLRGNGLIGEIQQAIARRGQRQWVIMETVDDSKIFHGLVKRALYRRLLQKRKSSIEGILAIGANTAGWLAKRGFPESRISPFAYFVRAPSEAARRARAEGDYIFAFVGNLEPWKNPTLLLRAFLALKSDRNAQLHFIGDGSEQPVLQKMAQDTKGRVRFLGRLPMRDVAGQLANIDRLVLPSIVDGWGVVASEAMLLGVPVTCSDACGVHGAVASSPGGQVIASGSEVGLTRAMRTAMQEGRWSRDRHDALAAWAKPLSAEFGALYLEAILNGTPCIPIPDWLRRP